MQYHTNGTKVVDITCPKCGSEEDVTWGSYEFDDGDILQLGYCDTCDIEWYDVYTLTRKVIIQQEDTAGV